MNGTLVVVQCGSCGHRWRYLTDDGPAGDWQRAGLLIADLPAHDCDRARGLEVPA